MPKPTVLIARSKHPRWPQVCAELRRCPEVRRVETTPTARGAVRLAAMHNPGLILLDLELGRAAATLLPALELACPKSRLARLGETFDAADLAAASAETPLSCLARPDLTPRLLATYLAALVNGDVVVSRAVGAAPPPGARDVLARNVARFSVWPRECQVAEGLMRGLGRKEIARELGLGVGTLAEYTGMLYRKLRVTGAAPAVARLLGWSPAPARPADLGAAEPPAVDVGAELQDTAGELHRASSQAASGAS